MNEQFDIVNLLKDKKALIRYILDMIQSSEKFAMNLPLLREKGWSEQGMLDKAKSFIGSQHESRRGGFSD